MIKKFLIIFLVFAGFSAWSQSAEAVSELLASENVTYGQLSYITANALTRNFEGATEEETFDALKKSGLLPKKAKIDRFVTFGEISSVCHKIWNINGSFMLMIFPSERYAFRQLKLAGVIDESAAPERKCTGHEVLAVITDCMEFYKFRGELL